MQLTEERAPTQTQTQSARTWGGETRQNHLYKPFLRGALATVLTIGCTLGAANLLVMGFSADLGAVWKGLIQAHAYGQIFGWVGLFIMGIAYHTVPRFFLRPLRRPGLVLPSFLLAVGGLVIRFFSQPFAPYPAASWLVVLSALLGLAGMSLFAWAMYDTIRHGEDRFGSSADRLFLGAGFAWLWLASAATVVATLYLALNSLGTIPPAWNDPYLRAALNGAVITIVLGYTLRTVPHIMGVRPPAVRPMQSVFALYTLSVLAQVAADARLLTGVGSWLSTAGAFGEVIALLAFVSTLGIFRVKRGSSAGKKNPWPERFIRTAYFWLLFASALNLAYSLSALVGRGVPHSFVASYHHAVTVGFISMMIVGMSMKLVPVFIGAVNKQPQVPGLVFALLLTGNTARIFGQSLADLYGGVFYLIMGLSGFVEVVGLMIYAVTLWRALDQPSYGQATATWQPIPAPTGRASSSLKSS